jgi:hypothetical protein
VRKYRVKDNWDERLKEIRREVDAEIDETVKQMLARQGKFTRGVQVKILEVLFGPKLDGRSGRSFRRVDSEKLVNMLFKAFGEERVTRGEVSDRQEILARLQDIYKQEHPDGQ